MAKHIKKNKLSGSFAWYPGVKTIFCETESTDDD